MTPRRVVFWQPIPSMHQLPFIEAFAEGFDGDVSCVCGDAVTPDRIALGWSNPADSKVRLSTPPLAESLAAISAAGPDTLQVFSGMHCHPYVNACFRRAVSGRAPVAVITESYDPRGARGLIRRGRSWLDACRFRRRVIAIFAMGKLGERWFKAAGYPADRIHPFAYVTPVSGVCEAAARSSTAVRILYVGQLIPRKGIDLLLRALATERTATWSLTIVGRGPAEAALRELAAGIGIADRVSWIAPMPNVAIPVTMAGHDVLVLPSRYDGWGAVVNEALSVGTPVICSDMCGASDLIRSPAMGAITKAGSVASLAAAIRARVVMGRVSDHERRRLAESAANFSPAAVADYFQAVLQSCFAGGSSPSPPWRTAL
jgi:glycosyltransferase involved in cell wall biosynthesis